MKRILLFICFSFFFIVSAFATHNRAGEITYKHLPPSGSNGSQYRYGITITTYTNTFNTTADRCELTVNFGDGDSAIAPRINGPSSLCPNTRDGVMLSSPANTKLNIYYVEHVYSGSGSYIITVEDPNRNAGICNIPNSVNASFFLRTELVINPFLGSNSSPTLLNPPLDMACVGECFEHNPGAYDAEGDSLSYELTTCYANGAPIFGYTLPPNMGINSINVLNGDLIWCTPPQICQYNVAILIKEYRLFQGVRYYVGSILRDMQIDVASCSNNAPQINNINDTCVVAGTNITFGVTATDPQNNVITLSATGGPFQSSPSANFPTVSGLSPLTGTFSWTPSCTQVQLMPHLVTFKADDNHPSTPLVNFESVFIRVIAPAPTGLTATPNGASILLNWNSPFCNATTGANPLKGFYIYRKNTCDPWVHADCETGVPSYTGYTLIGTTNATTLTFTDNNNGQGLIHGVNYSYMVVAYYNDGSQSYASTKVCVQLVQDVPIITNVSVLTTNSTSGSIWTHWVKPVGNSSNLDTIVNPPPYEYRLMVAQGFNPSQTAFSQIASYSYASFSQLTDTGFVHTNINTETSPWTYRVDFYSNGLLKGSTHTASSVFLSSSPAGNEVNLSWQEIVPWTNYQYFIYKEIPQGSSTFVLIDSTINRTYVDTGLVNGVNYCYKVVTKGEYSDPALPRPLFNASQIKCETPIDIVPPCQPSFAVNNDCDNVVNTITWTNPNLTCSDDDAVQYNVYFSPTTDGTLQLVYSSTDMSTTTFIHSYDYEGTPSVAGCYVVTAVDSFANESVIINKICVDNCPVYELPNVFTPNGDNINEFFIPLPYRFVKDIDIKIYDRWGLLMFETTDPDIFWDGTNKDTKIPCSDGVYYYVCTVNEIRVEGIVPRTLKGFVQLIKQNPKPNN
ncbi:MAG: gliding motility-associated C-terminal domain-containing protein [Bacteroidia bacterium]|nr:gliding motility-associated C-terminal domain-containing protein [Bacteroidia bacterium]